MTWFNNANVENTLQKDLTIITAEMFTSYMAPPQANGGTIENEETLARQETPIMDAFKSLGIKTNSGKFKAKINDTEATYTFSRDMDSVKGRVVEKIRTSTTKSAMKTIDTKERFVTAPVLGVLSDPDQEIYETIKRQDEMGRIVTGINLSLYAETLERLREKHIAFLNEYLEIALLKSLRTNYKEKEIISSGTPVPSITENLAKKFNASFFDKPLKNQSISPDLLVNIKKQLYLSNKVRSNTNKKMLIIAEPLMFDEIVKQFTVLPEYQNVYLAKQVTNDLVNQLKNNQNSSSPNIEQRFLLESEKARTSITFGDITVMCLRYDLAYECYNVATGNFEVKVVTPEAYATIDPLTPGNIDSQMMVKNPKRVISPLRDTLGWITREILDAAGTDTLIDGAQYLSNCSFTILPNQFDKGGSIPLQNGTIYGDAANKQVIVDGYKDLYEAKLANYALVL